MNQPKIVVLGGGTGSFSLLPALKELTPNITAVVTMSDDGGSTGVLRDELGVLPPGDVRQCLVALADDHTSPILRQLFNFRFEEGSLAGHSFGNLFLSATEKMTTDFGEAISLVGEVLHITGQVVPITLGNVRLAISWGDVVVRGEGVIDKMDFKGHHHQTPRLFLEPSAAINPIALTALAEADAVILAPGDIYTSLGPLLVVDGVAKALARTKVPIVYTCNLVVNPRQTPGWSVADHARELERLTGQSFITHVIYNTGKPNPKTLSRYDEAGEKLVKMKPAEHKSTSYKLIGTDLLSRQPVSRTPGDKLAAHRSFIRHNGPAVAQAIRSILSES
ncbi:MAG: gluconeogenesis factor YvcK family protein [Candidatus Saccharimonadales bacterium]